MGFMARALRIEYAGAAYHLMARGNHGQGIFQDDADRRSFLLTLGEACQKTGWVVHADVLMSNHYHLLVETPEAKARAVRAQVTEVEMKGKTDGETKCHDYRTDPLTLDPFC